MVRPFAPLLLGIALLLGGCAGSKVSTTTGDPADRQTVSRIAIAPGSGVLGEALAVELFNSGMTVIDANEASSIIGRVGLREFEIASTQGYAAMRDAGIDAVLVAKSVDASDGTPESASVRVTSSANGQIIAGVTWQNGWGGQRGSVADRTMRKNLSDAAKEISEEILKRVAVAP